MIGHISGGYHFMPQNRAQYFSGESEFFLGKCVHG